jgi:hypothetical protein
MNSTIVERTPSWNPARFIAQQFASPRLPALRPPRWSAGIPPREGSHPPAQRAYLKALRAAEMAAWDALAPGSRPQAPAASNPGHPGRKREQPLDQVAATALILSSLIALAGLTSTHTWLIGWIESLQKWVQLWSGA